MPRTIRDPRIQRFVLLGHPMSGTTGMISQIGREGKRLHHGRVSDLLAPAARFGEKFTIEKRGPEC
jgi:hypothetical protein